MISWCVNIKKYIFYGSDRCRLPLLLQVCDGLLQTADFGFLLIQDQDEPRVQLGLQGVFTGRITPHTEHTEKHISFKRWKSHFLLWWIFSLLEFIQNP